MPSPHSTAVSADPVGDDKSGHAPVLRILGLCKAFGGTRAVDDVSLDLWPGEVVALLGQNGAGKSTLIKILAGVHRSDAGSIELAGQAFDPAESSNPAISFIHQDLGLIEWMTVAENFALAQGFPRRWGLVDWRAVERRAARALESIAPDIAPTSRVQDLSRAAKSLVAIARALDTEARVVVLDEPTASLPQGEVELLFTALRRLRERRVALIYVSHRLDEVFEIADRIVVMRDGRVVAREQCSATQPEQIVDAIVGRALVRSDNTQAARGADVARGKPLLELHDVICGGAGPVSFTLHRGEILGLVGLRGAGQEAVGRALIGAIPVSAGQITIEGRPAPLQSPATAIGAGIGFVPSDRLGEAIAARMTVGENMFVNPALAGRRLHQPASSRAEHAEALELGRRVALRPNNPAAAIESLSGGNQQKVVMARWLRAGGRLLVLEEPTAGVDVGAKQEIYDLLSDALAQGLAILLVSTDLEEVERICHRALVFARGRIAASLEGDDLEMSRLVAVTSLSPAQSLPAVADQRAHAA